MISASWRFVVMDVAPATSRGRMPQAFGYEGAQALRETAQAHLAIAQRSDGIAARRHARLDPLDERPVFEIHAAVDPPVEVARDAHLPTAVRMHVGDLPNERLRRRDGH